MQQGGSPTPFDRNMGTKQAAKCVEWLVEKLRESTRPDGTIYTDNPDTAAMMGVIRRQYRFTPLTDLVPATNIEWVHVMTYIVLYLYIHHKLFHKIFIILKRSLRIQNQYIV